MQRMNEAGYLKGVKQISYKQMRDFVKRREYTIQLDTRFHTATELKASRPSFPCR